MSATAIRLKKEARALFWPWVAVIAAGALPGILNNSYTRKMNLISFFVGVPLLATLSLGNEFHERTLSLWLTQPVSRVRLWTDKISVLLPAALSAALLSEAFTFTFTWPHLGLSYRAAAFVCVIGAAGSAPFWTLVTRSTVGGFVLISFYLSCVFWAALKVADVDNFGEELQAALPAATMTAIAILGICYIAVMLWLGALKLERLHVTGGSADDDLLLTDTEMLPKVWARWFRCRTSGAILNLIRKEFRILEPFWLFTMLFLVSMTGMTIFGLLKAFPIPIPDHHRETSRGLVEWTVFFTLGSFDILLPVFAGILSLGEEKTSGTLAWQMTLPVSPRRQWLIKLVTAMVAGFASSVLLPLLVVVAAGSLRGSPYMFLNLPELHDWALLVPVITFSAFWCACAANGTKRAAVWVAVAPAVIVVVNSVGTRLGRELAGTTGTVGDLIVSRFHLNPLALAGIADSARAGVLWLYVPTLLVALFQSYRLLRTSLQESALRVPRSLAPLASVTVLWSLVVTAGFTATKWQPFEETRRGIDSSDTGTEAREFTGRELGSASSMSALTERWLEGSSVSITPGDSQMVWYRAAIHLVGGMECKMTVSRYGGSAASCANAER